MQPAGRLHHSDAFPQRHHPERIVGGNSKITATLGHTATPEGAGGTGSSSGDSPVGTGNCILILYQFFTF